VTHLRQIMLEALERRNYASATIRCYIRTVEHFARHFHRPPDQLRVTRPRCLSPRSPSSTRRSTHLLSNPVVDGEVDRAFSLGGFRDSI